MVQEPIKGDQERPGHAKIPESLNFLGPLWFIYIMKSTLKSQDTDTPVSREPIKKSYLAVVPITLSTSGNGINLSIKVI